MNEDGSKGNELSLVISPPMRQIRKTWVFFVCHIFKMRGQHKWWWENTKGWFGGRYFAVGIHQLSNFSLAYQKKKKKKPTWELFWLCHLNLFRRRKLWVLRAIINSEGNHRQTTKWRGRFMLPDSFKWDPFPEDILNSHGKMQLTGRRKICKDCIEQMRQEWCNALSWS